MNVIFLGAGASKALGFLGGNEILPKIIENLSNETLFADYDRAKEKRALLKKTLRQLIPGLSSNAGDLSITDVLSLIDFSISSGITLLPKDGFFELRRLRHLVDAAIIEVLNVEPDSNENIRLFADVLRRFKQTVVITSNYDLIPERVFQKAGIPAAELDYGFDWRRVTTGKIIRRPADGNSYALLKLHGSLNWLKCPSCEQIYINLLYAIADLGDFSDSRNYGSEVTCHCGYAPLRSLLITPSLARFHPEAQLKQLVLAGIEYIRQASSVTIIGYSMPSEDLAIRSMFIRGMRANKNQPKVKVFQISDAEAERYRAFFPKMDYFTSGLDGFLKSF